VIIIAGYELVDAEDRNVYVAAFVDLVARARHFDGCRHAAIRPDWINPNQVNREGRSS
jgi:hypothetical protein